MKKLIFIDNDSQERAKEDVSNIQRKLELWGGLPSDYVETVEIVSDFSNIPKEDAYKILYSKDNCVCSWSMYTANHYGSLYQLMYFLRSASVNEIKDLVYIDCSGMILKAIEGELRSERTDVLHILNAIETNNIISFDTDNDYKCYRLRVKLKGSDLSPFSKQNVDLVKLLSK